MLGQDTVFDPVEHPSLLDQRRLGGVSDISVLFNTPFTTMDLPTTWGIELEARF